MFHLFILIVLLVPAVFGGFMLFTPMERLVAGVAWTRLPMPKGGSRPYSLLKLFWRGMGVAAWSFVAFVIFMLFFHRT